MGSRQKVWFALAVTVAFVVDVAVGRKSVIFPRSGFRYALSFGQSKPEEPTETASSIGATTQSFGLEGYCPITLLMENEWRSGEATWSATHRGRTYRFAGETELAKFQANPDAYVPLLSGYDPVEYTESQRLVDGKRRHGLFYENSVCLFASEANLEKFAESPERFLQVRQLEENGIDASGEGAVD